MSEVSPSTALEFETALSAMRKSNAETEKFIAESHKLAAEADKLRAETKSHPMLPYTAIYVPGGLSLIASLVALFIALHK